MNDFFDLVARLRNAAEEWERDAEIGLARALREAADRIETLERGLREMLEWCPAHRDEWANAEAYDQFRAARRGALALLGMKEARRLAKMTAANAPGKEEEK